MSRIAIVLTASLLALATVSGAQDAEREQPVQKFYDIGGLYPGSPQTLRKENEGEFVLLGPMAASQRMDERDRVGRPGSEQLVGTVEEILRATDGSIEIESTDDGRHLIVRAKPSTHKQLESVLDLLLHQCAEPFEIEVRYLSIRGSQVNDEVLGILNTVSEGSLSPTERRALEKLDSAGGRTGGTISIPHGWWSTYQAKRERRYVPDFDVEIAQAAQIADPVPVPANEGVSLAIRPFLLNRNNGVMLRVVVSAGELGKDFRRFPMATRDLGELEQSDFRGGVASTEIVTEVGRLVPIVLGSPTGDPDMRWEILLLKVRAAPKPAPPGSLNVIPVGALGASDYERRLGWADVDSLRLLPSRSEAGRRATWGSLVANLDAAFEEPGFLYETDWLHGGSLVARANKKAIGSLQLQLAQAEYDLLWGTTVSIRCVVSTDDGEGNSRNTLTALLSGPIVTNRTASFAALRRLDYVGDYDVEVAQEARVADPKQHVAYGGIFANVDLSRSSNQYRLRLEMRVSALSEGILETSHRAAEVGPLQTVPERTRTVNATFLLVDGSKSIDLGRNPFDPDGPGRLLAIVQVGE